MLKQGESLNHGALNSKLIETFSSKFQKSHLKMPHQRPFSKRGYANRVKNDGYWLFVSKSIKTRDKNCKICNSSLDLEVHHITYDVNGVSIIWKELEHSRWLVTLCNKCHKLVHSAPQHEWNPKNKNKKPLF